MTTVITSKTSPFTGFSFSKYGKAILLKPSDKYQLKESDKYFNGGWWNATLNGWVFKQDAFEQFKPMLDKKHKKTINEQFSKQTSDEVDYYLSKQKPLKHFIYKEYKKGYLLYVQEKDVEKVSFPSDTKYFHNAWWMESQNCWFFKMEYLDSIRLKGAKHINESTESSEMDSTEEESYNSTEESDEFRDDSNDSDYVPDDSDMSDDYMSEDEDEDELVLSGLVTYKQYGKGWLVKPKKNCDVREQKYLNGGWWMPKKQGWFFRDEDFQKLSL